MAKVTPTQEQLDIIEACKSGINVKVEALAGSGKTSTLAMVTKALGKKKGLYLAFNKSIADDAKSKMSKNCECKTTHSLAYRNTDRKLLDKLSLKPVSAYKIVEMYKVKPIEFTTCLKDADDNNIVIEKSFSPIKIVCMAKNTVNKWCYSANTNLCEDDLATAEWFDKYTPSDVIRKVNNEVLKVAKEILKMMLDVNSSFPITHDLYLKLYTLRDDSILDVDYILLDESQDSNPCIIEFIKKQKCQIICVGDTFQQIYQWRGSVNAMNNIPSDKTLYLTKSFRFGKNVCDVANTILSYAGFDKEMKSLDTVGKDEGKYNTYLYRSNAGALEKFFELIEQGEKPYININTSDIKQFVFHWIALCTEKETQYPHPLLSSFKKASDVELYLEETKDKDLQKYLTLVKKYGKNIIENIDKGAKTVNLASCVITTAHKAKGLEWNNVYIGDDFRLVDDKGNVTDSPMELNLIYVAVTRAKNFVNVNNVEDFLSYVKF